MTPRLSLVSLPRLLLLLFSLCRTVPTRLPRQHLCRAPLTRPPMWSPTPPLIRRIDTLFRTSLQIPLSCRVMLSALSRLRPPRTLTFRRFDIRLVSWVGLCVLVIDEMVLLGTPPWTPMQCLNLLVMVWITVIEVLVLLLALVRGLIDVLKHLLPLVNLATWMCDRFLISIPMALLGSPSSRSMPVRMLAEKTLLAVGLLTDVLCRVVSRTG